jgi:hypothetical protein
MISLRNAEKLLDFSARLGKGQRAQEQLEGAVALHNLLQQHSVAYLADEVGMGKTYVALGVLALFRHFDPQFRVAIIAPRENIQRKWMKELRNFVRYNVRYDDLRVRGIGGRPLRQLVACNSLPEFVREATLDQNRDFFLRLTSFSLPLSGRETVDPESVRKLRDGLRRYIPWLSEEVFDLRRKQDIKENFARAINCALPVFDLVIVDEGHNLKHGLGQQVASRNRVLALAFGHPEGTAGRKDLFPGYGPRAKRVLFLSATPVEETYDHLWNQLQVLGMGGPFADLTKPSDEVDEERKKEIARQFLIRRVTSIQTNGEDLTKNLYRREWREGGVFTHDDPIHIDDDRHRLVVALVQKKVAELLGHERFNTSFQIGMLASFESFLETAKVKKADEETGIFDGTEQTEDQLEREGIDVHAVNSIARDYHQRFNDEMPHPKMDAVVRSLSSTWRKGEKALIFVRRVASVTDLKRKLDNAYNDWLLEKLRRELPNKVFPRFEQEVARFVRERTTKYEQLSRPMSDERMDTGEQAEDVDVHERTTPDEGGLDTFFAWFFRGEGPKGVVSGANIQRRFIQRGTAYATFFEDNYVASLLECDPDRVPTTLARALRVDERTLRPKLQERSVRFLGQAKKVQRGDQFEAVQAAAVEWMTEVKGPFQDRARIVWHERFKALKHANHASEAPPIGDLLEMRTFFTELRKRPALRDRLWPELSSENFHEVFRERELRAQLLGTAARLGHAFIDLYIMTISRLGSLDLRTQEEKETRGAMLNDRIDQYLSILEQQMGIPLEQRDWGAFDELAEISRHFQLIMDVNTPDAKDQSLLETRRLFGQMLRQQQPVGGVYGGVNLTMVRQFRMPGYPLVLITTDVLQEGEDLHTFCSSVHHYGISWTPSSMEQRIGRIDRVRSQTDRRLTGMSRPLMGADKLQVYFPYLEDSVEVLQVQTILERMNIFLRLMHEGLTTTGTEEKRIDAKKEFVRGRRHIPQITSKLMTAFGIRKDCIDCRTDKDPMGPEQAKQVLERFNRLKEPSVKLKGVFVNWEPQAPEGMLIGIAKLGKRQQPFNLILESFDWRPLVRCISPVGHIQEGKEQEIIQDVVSEASIRVGAILKEDNGLAYNLTVEGDALLGEDPLFDSTRVGLLVRRVVAAADRIERDLSPGKDEPLPAFRQELEEEIGCDR